MNEDGRRCTELEFVFQKPCQNAKYLFLKHLSLGSFTPVASFAVYPEHFVTIESEHKRVRSGTLVVLCAISVVQAAHVYARDREIHISVPYNPRALHVYGEGSLA
jgi:hypothetical protein